jgi:sugar phosphate isomerase/epimerase
MSTLTLGCGEWGFRNRPIGEWLPLAASLGFRHLEFGIGGGWPGRLPESPAAADVNAFRRLVAQHGVSTHHCCLENDFTRPDPAGHEQQVRKVLAQLAPAADCGAKLVRLFAGFTPADRMTESIWARLLDALQTCAAAAARHGMRLAIETHGAITQLPDGSLAHQHTASTRRDLLERLLGEMPPEIGINYDPGNLKAADPEDKTYAADVVAGRITYCHLKDWRRAGKGWLACAPGDDDLDYRRLLPVQGFDGVYLIEYEPLEDTVEGIHRSLAYLRRIVPGATLG